MIEGFLRGMLGPLQPALDFVLNNPAIITLFLSIIILVYIAGRIQLHRIEGKTETLVVTLSKDILLTKENITPSGLYKRIYPEWSRQVVRWGLFIPSKHDFYPTYLKPDRVAEKMKFDAKWIENILTKKNIKNF